MFDQGTPAPLRRSLAAHSVDTAYERGWQTLENGELLSAAESDGYDILITTDQNLKYQQNLSGHKIIIVILLSTSWPRIRQRLEIIEQTIEKATAGSYYEVPIP